MSDEDGEESDEYVAKSVQDLVDIGARSKRKKKAQKQQERQPRPRPQPAKRRRSARGGRNQTAGFFLRRMHLPRTP